MSEDDIRLAEEYCLGLLDESTKKSVEERMRVDAEFSNLVGDTKVLLAGIQERGHAELKEELTQWEKEHKPTSGKRLSMKAWAALGLAAGLILVAIIYYWPGPEKNNLTLFDQYFEPYPNVVMPLVRSAEIDSSLAAVAYRTYEKGDYEKAIELFTQLPASQSPAQFYIGQCYLAMGQPETAISYFQKCLQIADTFEEQAQWYLSLAYLKNGDRNLAREELKKIVSHQNSFSARAESLLKQL